MDLTDKQVEGLLWQKIGSVNDTFKAKHPNSYCGERVRCKAGNYIEVWIVPHGGAWVIYVVEYYYDEQRGELRISGLPLD